MGGTNVVRQALAMSERFRKHGYTSQILQISKRMVTRSLQLQLSSDDGQCIAGQLYFKDILEWRPTQLPMYGG